jgi:hypothetical protein
MYLAINKELNENIKHNKSLSLDFFMNLKPKVEQAPIIIPPAGAIKKNVKDDISKFAYTSSATNAHIVNIDVKIPSKIPKITSPF